MNAPNARSRMLGRSWNRPVRLPTGSANPSTRSVRQAADDLQVGVQLLEERIAERTGDLIIVDETEAQLAPEDELKRRHQRPQRVPSRPVSDRTMSASGRTRPPLVA